MKAKYLAELLKKNELKIAVAESCTGGMLTSALTEIPGVSDVLYAGYVTYANKAKEKILDVDKNILSAYGAVSKECATAMAEGAKNAGGNPDISIAITGIAGPTGGSEAKPVGTVYIALCWKKKTEAHEFFFKGSRSGIRKKTLLAAIALLEERLETIT